MDHYARYDPDVAAFTLFSALIPQLEPEMRQRLLALVQSPKPRGGGLGEVASDEEIRKALESLDWEKWRPEIVEIFLHRSRVLEVIPESQQSWLPLVHDSLLLFLNRLSDERFLERLIRQSRLSRDADRGDLLLAFVARTPSLQKLGQILARYPAVAGDLRLALQTLENSVVTTGRDEIVGAIEEDLGPDVISRYRIRFADEVLAEASVGAVIRATFVPSDGDDPQDGVCKLLKPYAIVGLEEELHILEEVTRNLQDHGEFYDIGDAPVVELFEELQDALAKEIRVTEEQSNLAKAARYYQDVDEVLIPEIYPFSTPGVTCMEFVNGVKITDAFPNDPKARAELAKRLSDALTFDVIFSGNEEALFHGDPHAGNVLHVVDDPDDPYRIALIDWGLAETFPYEQRAQFVQLLVGITLRDAERIANNVGALVHLEEASPEQKQRVRELVEPILAGRDREAFESLNDLLTVLARAGYPIRFNTAIFIKSQLTIGGILLELDPEFEQGDYLMDRVSGQVFRETHTRLLRALYFPAWNSHDYRSMMSNEDVKDIQLQRTGATLKKIGKGIWAGISYPAELFR
jgi:ubiquinone biosynthesis protein